MIRLQKEFSSILIFLLLLPTTIFAKQQRPVQTIDVGSPINDFVLEAASIYPVGNSGTLHCYSLSSGAQVWNIELPNIVDFMGDEIAPKILSIDKILNEDIFIVASQGKSGFRNVYLINDKKPTCIIEDIKQKWMISEVRFLNQNQIIISLISSEIILFDLSTLKVKYRVQVSQSVLSDFEFSDNKTELAIADESGIITMIESKSGKIINTLSGANLDKVNHVSCKAGKIITAGQDRKLGIYTLSGNTYESIDSPFLIFNCAISTSADYCVYTCNEQNELNVLNLTSMKSVAILSAHKAIVTKIELATNKIVTTGEDGLICIWTVPNLN